MSIDTDKVHDLIGESFDKEAVPSYPARIYWKRDGFFTNFPHAPMRFVEVRFRKAHVPESGDFTIWKARLVDTSDPENCYRDWVTEDRG